MSNNKQQTAVKLYTEADLKKVISIYSEEYKTSTDEILKELNLTPIELPTDKEIKEVINPFQNEMDDFDLGFRNGVQWLREKIQGGEQ